MEVSKYYKRIFLVKYYWDVFNLRHRFKKTRFILKIEQYSIHYSWFSFSVLCSWFNTWIYTFKPKIHVSMCLFVFPKNSSVTVAFHCHSFLPFQGQICYNMQRGKLKYLSYTKVTQADLFILTHRRNKFNFKQVSKCTIQLR